MTDRPQTSQQNTVYKVIPCTVTDAVIHEQRKVDSRTGVAKFGARVWRELEIRRDDGQVFSVTGDVVNGAAVGDDIALVYDARGREPLCLANITRGTHVMHGSADPSMRKEAHVVAYAFLIAVVAAIPGCLLFFLPFVAMAPDWSDRHSTELLKAYPWVLIPASIYAAVRLDRWSVARAKRVHDEVVEALDKAGVPIRATPPRPPSSGRAKPA